MAKGKEPYSRMCNVCKREFTYLNTRECNHSSVIAKYGNIVCGYCCKKCRFSAPCGTGLACTYKLEGIE